MFKKLTAVFVLGSLISVSACTSSNVQLHQGKQALKYHRYEKAFKDLLPLANEGNAQAQYAVGYAYYYGKGVNEDQEKGQYWINKAAQQGYAPAVRALEIEAAYARK